MSKTTRPYVQLRVYLTPHMVELLEVAKSLGYWGGTKADIIKTCFEQGFRDTIVEHPHVAARKMKILNAK